MQIETYKKLISSLPVKQQCFETKRTTWNKAEIKIKWLRTVNDKIFADKETLRISRQDIFDTKENRELIIKTIYWGYTARMRGNNYINIFKILKRLKIFCWI